jgi:hypothetical protein
MENNQAKMEARRETSTDKSEVLRSTLVFRVDIHQAKMDIHQEKIGAAVHSIRSGVS